VETAVVQGAAPPRADRAAKPTVGYVVEKVTSAVLMVRIEPTAEASFAAIRDLRRFGIAMAAMIRMIATTISNSIREKPFCFFMMLDLLDNFYVARARYTYRKPETNAAAEVIARSVSCSTLIINRLLKLRRMRPLHLSTRKWAKIVDLALFCPSPKAQ